MGAGIHVLAGWGSTVRDSTTLLRTVHSLKYTDCLLLEYSI